MPSISMIFALLAFAAASTASSSNLFQKTPHKIFSSPASFHWSPFAQHIDIPIVTASYQQPKKLGPFFGYFPEMFGKPCPICPDQSAPCAKCGDAPPITDEIKGCSDKNPIVSSSPSGTIKVSDGHKSDQCDYVIVTFAPYTKLKLNCKATANPDLEFVLSTVSGTFGATNTVDSGDVFSTGTVMYLKLFLGTDGASDCTWTAVKV